MFIHPRARDPPSEIFDLNHSIKNFGGNKVNKRHFFISIDGQQIEVSREIYLTYYRSKRRERYYGHDIKIERAVYDEAGNISGYMPPKEDSLERLIESSMEFPSGQKSVEATVIDKIMVEGLHKALDKLSMSERELIHALYFQGMTEREYAEKTGISKTALHARKIKVLASLKNLLEK